MSWLRMAVKISSFRHIQCGRYDGDKGRILEIMAIEPTQLDQIAHAQRRAQGVNIFRFQAQVFREEFLDVVGHREIDRQANHGTKAPLAHAALNRFQQIFGLEILNFHFRVARHSKRVRLEHLHSRKQPGQVFDNDLLQPDQIPFTRVLPWHSWGAGRRRHF